MLTTALNTIPVLSNKVGPAPHAPSDQFKAITGPYRSCGHISVRTSRPSTSIRSFPAPSALTSCSRMDADKLARSTYPAMFSDSSRDRPAAWRRKPSSTQPCIW